MFRFSLRTLFIVVTLAALASYVGYLLTRPYWVIMRVDCGNGRWIELLEPNGFRDGSGPVHYQFSDMKLAEPPAFEVWGCGALPPIQVVTAEGGELVALATADELHVVVDFKSGLSWPPNYSRKVDDNVRRMLGRLRRERSELWLWSTFDGELTKPDLPE